MDPQGLDGRNSKGSVRTFTHNRGFTVMDGEGRLAIMVNGGGVDSPLQEGHPVAPRGEVLSCLRLTANYDGRSGYPVTFMIAANG